MIRNLTIRGFKSLGNLQIRLPRFTVLFGPNAAGKSNILDAVQTLSRISSKRTLSDALTEPIRGYPIEAFAFPSGGLMALLAKDSAEFTLATELEVGKDRVPYRYRIAIGIHPASGVLSIRDEFLARLGKQGNVSGNPIIEKKEDELRIRRKSKPGNPRKEDIGLNYAILSDLRLGGIEYRAIESCRAELSACRTYYLDPRVAMRTAKPPSDVTDIGVLGEDIAPFLYRLMTTKYSRYYDSIRKTLRALVPGVEDLSVDLDKRRGSLDIQIRQDGIAYSSRIISEGTLRVLALCALAVNPWKGSLLAFEEPENGVHPRRLELIVELLTSISRSQQVLVTTHSPLLCQAVLKRSRTFPKEIELLRVRRGSSGTEVTPLSGPLFDDTEIAKALADGTEDNLFESLMMRGLLDE